MFLKIQSQQSEKGVTDHNKTSKRKQNIRKYFVTVFSIRERFLNGETF